MGSLPPWYRGRRIKCDICGAEYSERDGNLRKQRGIWVCRLDYDTLTEEQRQSQIKRR
jgi:hypothetical protein